MKKISLLLVLIGLVACGKAGNNSNPSDATSDSEISAASVGGANSSSDSQGTQALNIYHPFKNLFQIIPQAQASSVYCPTLVSGGAGCSVSGNTATLSYNNCSFANPEVNWVGGLQLTFNGPPTCGSYPAQSSGYVIRNFLDNTYRLSDNHVNVKLNTTATTGYQTQVSGGEEVDFNSASSRTITIHGLNVVAYIGEYRVWDHTISSDPIAVAVVGSQKNIATGTVRVQHNLAKYLATSTLSNLTFQPGCCLPVSGSISTVFTGNRTGSETLTFNGCGSANLASSAGSANITLHHCF